MAEENGDGKKPYGDVEYADPGYQSDKKKRYPVDTEEHARAAWSYINKASNASAYSSEDLSKVKAKIRSACKKFGIEISGEDDGDDSESKAKSGPIECRAAVQFSRVERNELVFLPVGIHAITPVSGGIGKPIKVLVNVDTAAAIEQQRFAIEARTDKRVYFDFNHEDGRASFWPRSFQWRQSEGVIAKGDWTESGRKAVEGKDFRAFSPVFHVDDKRRDPARVVCCDGASPNMGGLVNDPAFSSLPLWAKNAGSDAGSSKQTKGEDEMSTEEIAALRAKHQELEKKVETLQAIVAANTDDEPAKFKLSAAEAEARAAQLEVETAELKAKSAVLAETIHKRNRADADIKVKAAVMRGAIAAKDIVMQEKWRIQLTADPTTFGPMIDAMPGSADKLRGRISAAAAATGTVSITGEDPFSVFGKMARVLSDSQRASREDKIRLGEEFAAIYAGSFKSVEKNRDLRSRLIGTRLSVADDAIKAADVTDANLGTIAGTLVTQRTLELLKFIFPPLTRFNTDFSDLPATFNQTIMTRIITIPTVQTYSTATGWTDAVAGTTDVPIVINNHKGVPITFNEQLLASTMRRLFDEFAEASAYALGKNIVDTIYANLTDANFTNNTVQASVGFARSNVVDVGVALTLRGVPLGLTNRTMLLWPVAFGSLEKDPSMIQFGTNVPRPDIITEGLNSQSTWGISVESFDIYSAPNMPSNNANLVGFAGSKSALCLATRVPNDYTSILPGASFGNVQMVTDPDVGITVMQVQYVNHVLGTATSRIALMFGAAAGQTNAGQLIKAAAGTGSAR
jgi:phage I-like protein